MGESIPHFFNDCGSTTIEIGVKTFMCVGASPPFDHPHVFLTMGNKLSKVCPYCSTSFTFNPTLEEKETKPAGCFYKKETP